jgi:hypothetical protein
MENEKIAVQIQDQLPTQEMVKEAIPVDVKKIKRTKLLRMA